MVARREDGWMDAAMMDDALVAEILLRLWTDAAPPPSGVIPSRWGRRLPRSRPVGGRCEFSAVDAAKRKDGECSTRCSPITPLSWSGDGGAASSSTPDPGLEETNSFSPSSNRSKVTVEPINSIMKKTKKKKANSAELKVKESLLLTERTKLKQKLATAQASWEQEHAQNVMLKRIKVDLNTDLKRRSTVVSEDHVVGGSCGNIRDLFSVHKYPYVEPAGKPTGVGGKHPEKPVLSFDLNLLPLEEPSQETHSQMR